MGERGRLSNLDLNLDQSYVKGKHRASNKFQNVPVFSCMCKETVHIDILKTSRCGDRKMRQPISITKGPSTRIKKCNQFRQF